MKYLANRLTAMVLIVLAIGAIGFLASHFASFEQMVANEISLREYVSAHPIHSWILGFFVYTLFSIIPGTVGKSVVWGWLFGFWPAVVMVVWGLTLVGTGSFLAGRFLVRETVETRFASLIQKLNHQLEKEAAFYLLMLRVAHVPFSFVNYGLGTTSVKLRTFVWTTWLGLLPGTMIFVFVGTRIPTLAVIKEQGVWPLLDPILLSLLVATFIFPLLIRYAIECGGKRNGHVTEFPFNDFESLDESGFKG